MAARSALENKQGGSGSGAGVTGGRSLTGMLIQFLVVAIACFLAGIRMGVSGNAGALPMASVVMGVETTEATEASE